MTSNYQKFSGAMEERENVIVKRVSKEVAKVEQQRDFARKERALTLRKMKAKKFYDEKVAVRNKLVKSLEHLLEQFAYEIAGKPLMEVDYTCKMSVAYRKEQTNIYIATMVMIEKLQGTINKLNSDYTLPDEETKVVETETVKIMADAKALLKRRQTTQE
jgi:hypothetical protein